MLETVIVGDGFGWANFISADRRTPPGAGGTWKSRSLAVNLLLLFGTVVQPSPVDRQVSTGGAS